ncbi:uncharacterized protein LOC122027628 isoform X2 [Zingiber officinale]|uniref:FLZ-type domain-containing protein n=1 Tax=Zingiber officinale TaxID=94328 RepID=A0A8J5EUL1_ZINOF|nr:uncharacterized protein LOC122027628 isoform X2 [Zingiber officinale]KAG6473283.1 hypothetical protein ZIOFF_067197 [Zingiber officinale]
MSIRSFGNPIWLRQCMPLLKTGRLNSLVKQHEDFNVSCETNDGSSCGHRVVLSTHHSFPPTQYPAIPLLHNSALVIPSSLPPSLDPKMLPRTQSIFHVGEEVWEATEPSAAVGELERSSRGAIERLEGLRILIQHSVRQSNVVIKSCLKPCAPHHLLSLGASSSATQLGFLKTCFLCKSELSPHKDVYMYRGDQGFCSEECRGQQILIDERKEMELLSTRERLKAIHHRRLRESGRHKRRILVAA